MLIWFEPDCLCILNQALIFLLGNLILVLSNAPVLIVLVLLFLYILTSSELEVIIVKT